MGEGFMVVVVDMEGEAEATSVVVALVVLLL
jgi:hypothetical protein